MLGDSGLSSTLVLGICPVVELEMTAQCDVGAVNSLQAGETGNRCPTHPGTCILHGSVTVVPVVLIAHAVLSTDSSGWIGLLKHYLGAPVF